MKLRLYPRLALDGIRKNKRLYFPYILTCSGMVMMFYIIHYLAGMSLLEQMSGGSSTAMMLGFGTWIVALFALIFLFYTNSFLVRRRWAALCRWWLRRWFWGSRRRGSLEKPPVNGFLDWKNQLEVQCRKDVHDGYEFFGYDRNKRADRGH